MIYKFYDTCSLLLKVDNLWEEDTTLVISSITLEELEHIKTSVNKDPDVKFAARKLIHELDTHYGLYEVVIWNQTLAQMLKANNLPETPDSKIITSAGWFQLQNQQYNVVFITNDLC